MSKKWIIAVLIIIGISGLLVYNFINQQAVKKENEKKLQDFIRKEDLKEIIQSMGGDKRVLNDDELYFSIEKIKIDQVKLQINLNAYQYFTKADDSMFTHYDTTLEEIIADADKMTKDGEYSRRLKAYVDWYMLQEGQLTKYKEDLQSVLTRFYALHKDDQRPCPYVTLSDLSPDQINELSKHYNGSADEYELKDLKLEW